MNDKEMSYRIRYRLIGGHVHAHFWSSEFGPGTSHGKNGELVFRAGKDWEQFKTIIECGADDIVANPPTVVFIDETERISE